MSQWDAAFEGTSLATKERCYKSHPVLTLGTGKLHGGAALHPVKADIYVVLQRGDMGGLTSDPWEPAKVVEIQYAIRDMGVPENVPRFKKLVTWLCNQLQEGKTVHAGCIGGHGRTGTLFAAIVAEMLGEKDAIQYVRTHYCKKAVESKEQVEFLRKHYGVSPVAPTKDWSSLKGTSTAFTGYGQPVTPYKPAKPSPAPVGPSGVVRKLLPEGVSQSTRSVSPMASSRSLWKTKA